MDTKQKKETGMKKETAGWFNILMKEKKDAANG